MSVLECHLVGEPTERETVAVESKAGRYTGVIWQVWRHFCSISAQSMLPAASKGASSAAVVLLVALVVVVACLVAGMERKCTGPHPVQGALLHLVHCLGITHCQRRLAVWS